MLHKSPSASTFCRQSQFCKNSILDLIDSNHIELTISGDSQSFDKYSFALMRFFRVFAFELLLVHLSLHHFPHYQCCWLPPIFLPYHPVRLVPHQGVLCLQVSGQEIYNLLLSLRTFFTLQILIFNLMMGPG